MNYPKNQKIRKINLLWIFSLALMLSGLPLIAQETPMPRQEQTPPENQAPGQDQMQQEQMSPQSPMPQQQGMKENYSNDELKQFIDANKEATKVQEETQKEMVEAIEDEGLEVNTFNQIMTSQQDPQQKVEVSDGDMKKFNKAAEKVMKIQQDMEAKVVGAIEKTGMDVDKYSEIMLAYQSSPVVQEQVHKLLREEEKR